MGFSAADSATIPSENGKTLSRFHVLLTIFALEFSNKKAYHMPSLTSKS